MSLGRRRRAVRHHEDAGLHLTPALPSSCTTRTTAARTSGSVDGRTPCPRLKMWPGCVPALVRTSRVASTASVYAAQATRGIEVALDGLLADPPSALVEVDVPVDADDRAARAAPSGRAVRRCRHRRGWSARRDRQRRRSTRWVAGSAKRRYSSRVSEPAHESKSCTARAPWAIWARRNVTVISTSRSRSRSKSAGSRCIKVLMSANSRVGAPSTR